MRWSKAPTSEAVARRYTGRRSSATKGASSLGWDPTGALRFGRARITYFCCPGSTASCVPSSRFSYIAVPSPPRSRRSGVTVAFSRRF